jgi:hypothetical protein
MQRNSVIALIVGTLLGFASASAVTSPRDPARPPLVSAATPHSTWSVEHASIPGNGQDLEPAPTF